MKYSELKTALSTLIGSTFSWPATPTATGHNYIVPPSTAADQRPSVKISDIETKLATWLPNNPISQLMNGLPPELQSYGTEFLDHIAVGEFDVSVAPGGGGDPDINGFSFVFDISLTSPPTIGGVTPGSVGLELNLVALGGSLIWNPTLFATCTFLGADCELSVNLRSPAIQIVLADGSSAKPDTLLGSAKSGTSISSLQSDLGISGGGDTPTIDVFLVKAELSDQPTFHCLLALTTTGWTWKDCALTGIGIAFEHGGDTTDFTLATTATIGGVNADAAISVDKTGGVSTTTVEGGLSSRGTSLSDFLGTIATELGFTNPLPSLSEIEMTDVSFKITDKQGVISLEMTCGGAIAFDESGSSLQFTFTFKKAGAGDIDVKLHLGSAAFDLTDSSGTYVFSFTGSETVTLSELVHLAQIYPLYGDTPDISITLTSGLLAMRPGTSGHHDILGAIEFTLNATIDDPIVKLITGGHKIGLSAATLFAANTPWTMDDLQKISSPPIALDNPLPKGMSFSATLDLGAASITAPLTPPTTKPSTGGSGTSPTPKSVSSPSATAWFTVQRQIGPVYLDRVGLGLGRGGNHGPSVDILTDASFTIGPVSIGVEGFSIAVPFNDPSSVSVGLLGLDVTYNKPPTTISGGLLDKGDGTFIGDLQIRTETLFLAAVGEYAKKDDYTSLALFAALTDPPLGGPVYCYVTGLAAGGGYNSALQIPTKPSQVAQFPLVTAASGGKPVADPFTVIETSVHPEQGEDWLAVGLIFRSFEVVQSTALLTAAFGDDFQFAILGQSEMSVPPASDKRIAYAQVDVEAQYIPSQHALSVQGILTPNSYVLSKQCHIEGGFAAIFKESGNFVVSYGGYAHGYDYAAHGYPAVPRLRMIWNIDSHTNVKGSEYFALTPAAMMAGGGLQATWSCGIFSAWFDVSVDVMIEWKPFYYEAGFSMSLGVSFDLKILFVHIHFTFHIGAQLSIAGPPFHGHAHIDLDVISFDVDFGPSAGQPSALHWSAFRQMLPGNESDDASHSALLSAKVTDGLTKDLSQSKSSSRHHGDDTFIDADAATPPQPDWVVNGTHFNINIQSSLPVTKASSDKGPHTYTVTETPSSATVGILPMQEASADGTLDIVLTDPEGHVVKASTDPTSNVVVTRIDKDMAPAHWGTEKPSSSNTPPITCTSGYTLSGGAPDPAKTSKVDLSILLARPVAITAKSVRTASATPFATT